MKQFKALTEALEHYTKCPICNGELNISDDKHQALISEIPIYHNNEQVLICHELIDGDLIIIDKYTAEIDFIIRNRIFACTYFSIKKYPSHLQFIFTFFQCILNQFR